MTCLYRWWRQVTDPPHQKPAYAMVYIVTALTGLVTLMVPPKSIEGAIGPILMLLIGALWCAGGALAFVTLFSRWWWLERLALAVAALGTVLYGSVVAMLHIQAEGSRLTQLGIVILSLLLYLVRWISIRQWSYAPPDKE